MPNRDNRENRIVQRIDGRREDIAALTRDLVAIRTENPPGDNYREFVDYLSGVLRRLHLPAVISEVPDAVPSPRYILNSPLGEGPTVYLHGHYDVVPALSDDQFSPVIGEGRIAGRGTSDMKGAIASMVYALDALRSLEDRLDGRIEMVLVPDEETGGRFGCGFLSKAGRLGKNGIGVILGEPTSGVVWNACRGAITLRIRLKGKPAHVGLQHEGRNAFEGAIPIAAELLKLKREVERRRTGYGLDPDEARHSILMLGGEVAGGRAFNAVPGEFSFSVERRLNPEEDLEEEKARLLEAVDRSRPAGIEAEIEVVQESAPSVTEADGGFSRAVASVIKDVTGGSPEFELCPGLLESRFYAERGVPALTYGPGILSVSHRGDEYVEVSRLVECAKVYALTAFRLLNDRT